MKKIIILFSFAVLFFTSCSEKDNYSEPSEGIQGAVIDKETGDSIPSQQENGLRVRLYDQQYSSSQPIDFWGKQDGSFKNSKLFGGHYKMIVDNGAFYPLDTVNVELPTEEEFILEALPYLRISASAATEEDGKIVVESELSKTKPEEGKIVRRAVLANPTPYVDFNNFTNDDPIINTENIPDSELTSSTIKDTISGLDSGATYYIRIGGMVDEAGGDTYNYSKVIEVELP